MSATLSLSVRAAPPLGRLLARLSLVSTLLALTPPCATAQDANFQLSIQQDPLLTATGSQPGRAATVARFFLGGAAGLGLHEGGHLLFDALFGVKPQLKAVHFGPIPFFAISHQAGQSPRQEFVISSAGFWMQHLSSEIILARHPHLAHEHAPFRKGVLAFNVLASVAYGTAALAKAGPFERDTRAMADSLGVDERWIAVLVLSPAVLDAWRYFHPDAAWARWLSRGVKVGGVLLVLR